MVLLVRLALAFASILPAAWLWNHVSLTYSNPHDIAGVLAANRFNPSTNLVRFVILVACPSVVWLLIGLWRREPSSLGIPLLPAAADRRATSWPLVLVSATGLLVAVAMSLNWLYERLGWFYLDLFHDGDSLAPAWRWAAEGTLWTGNYLTHGAFVDVFSTVAGWAVFGARTIAACKAFQYVLDIAVPLAVWGFALVLQHAVRRNATPLSRALLVAFVVSLVYAAEAASVVWFTSRALAVLLSLGTLVLAFADQRRTWYFLAGLGATAALFSSSEAGIYTAAASLLAIVVFVTGSAWREPARGELLPWVSGAAVGHVAILAWFGPDEYAAWMGQIVAAATRWDFIYSYVYPSPLGAAWATHGWPMLLLALMLLGFVMMYPAYRADPAGRRLGQIHLLLVGISLAGYRTALGRSDLAHVQQGLPFACFGVAWVLWMLASRLTTRGQQRALVAACVPFAFALAPLASPDGIARVAGAVGALRAYAALPDSRFLSDEQRTAAPALFALLRDQPCAFVFPNEPGWYFLVRKPACTRFYFTVHASGDDYEREVAGALERTAPRFIVYSSPLARNVVDDMPNAQRLARLDRWIRERYAPARTIAGWGIYELRNDTQSDEALRSRP